MDVALSLFANEGYAGTSIDRIAKQAGISKGLLYNYFESKEDLVGQILLSGVLKITEGIFPENMDSDRFISDVEKTFNNMRKHKDFYKLYTALSVQPGVAEKLEELSEHYNDKLIPMGEYFQRKFGEEAANEIRLLSVLMKGYAILALFGNEKTMPVALLKKTVMNLVKERWR